MTAWHTNGFGESLGDSLVVSPGGGVFVSGKVWYVHSVTGSNSNDGRNSKAPLATLASGQANGNAGDIVVLMDGHAETFTATLTINKALTIVAGGQSSGKPTVKFTNNQSNAAALLITAAQVSLRNIWFEEDLTANNAGRVRVTGDSFLCDGCYFELDALSHGGSGLKLEHDTTEVADIRNTTFVSTTASGAVASLPGPGIKMSAGGFVRLNGVTFDGGTYGFTSGYAFTGDVTNDGVHAENITMIRGADAILYDGQTFFWQTSTDSVEPRIELQQAV